MPHWAHTTNILFQNTKAMAKGVVFVAHHRVSARSIVGIQQAPMCQMSEHTGEEGMLT